MAEENTATQAANIFRPRPVEEFFSFYTNNIQIQQTVFDLKLIFGELVQSQGKLAYVDQHSSVTMSWVQAKLLLYFLQLNMIAFEDINGKIKIPPELIPPEIVPIAEDNKDTPQAQALYELLKKFREQFISSL